MIRIAGLILIHSLMRKGIWIVRAGGVENDKEPEGKKYKQQGYSKELGLSRNTVSRIFKKTRIQES